VSLVEVDGVSGIFTAEHVVFNPDVRQRGTGQITGKAKEDEN
jgi:hypothetical protein